MQTRAKVPRHECGNAPVTAHTVSVVAQRGERLTGFLAWLRTHLGVVTMAGLFSFAAPVTFFTGILSVMRDPNAADILALSLWWLFYGAVMAGLLLAFGYACHSRLAGAKPLARAVTAPLLAAVAAMSATLSTAERADILLDQGIVQSVAAMHINAFILSFALALLFFAYLRRSRIQEEAAARLIAAQAAQREARLRAVQARLHAVQARIDPQLLFDMLDAVRRAYEMDVSRAERLLDELIRFLRAALPRLRTESSSVPREAELASAYCRLRALAGADGVELNLDLGSEVLGARFPPGVLLPLLEDVLRLSPGACRLTAARVDPARSRLVLESPARPSSAAIMRVRALLTEIYGPAGSLVVGEVEARTCTTVEVPYEYA